MSTRDYWQRQEEEPLFPDIDWQKPQNKKQAGKLLIIGGNSHGFESPGKAFELAQAAGEVKMLLPSALEKLMPQGLMPIVYAPSTDVGSFAKPDAVELDKYLDWADYGLIAGDLGHNSQTALFFEHLLKDDLPLTITKDALYYADQMPKLVLERPNTMVVASFSQLQRLLAGLAIVLDSKMGIVELVDVLSKLTADNAASIVVNWQGSIAVASSGFVSTTKDKDREIWQLEVATLASIHAMQNPTQIFEALTHAVYESVSKNQE